MTLTQDSVHSFLIDRDWTPEHPAAHDTADRIWYKQFLDVRPNCLCNADKDGIQIVIHGFKPLVEGAWRYEIVLTHQCQSGTWVKFKAYGLLAHELTESLDEVCDTLIRVWVAANV